MSAKNAICQFVYLNFSRFDTFTYYTTGEFGVDFAKFIGDGLTKHELFLNERVSKIAKGRLVKPAFQGGLQATIPLDA
eukprot:5410295-Heterocapsa_arctica.AAC.1